MTDSSRILAGQDEPDWYIEELWDLVDYAVELGEKHDCVIGANPSYAYEVEEMVTRIENFWKHGVQFIPIQTIPFMTQVAVGELLEEAAENTDWRPNYRLVFEQWVLGFDPWGNSGDRYAKRIESK